MISYRDRTFCIAATCKHFDTCDRALTDTVMAAAKRWWGNDNPPISIHSQSYGLPCYTRKIDNAKPNHEENTNPQSVKETRQG